VNHRAHHPDIVHPHDVSAVQHGGGNGCGGCKQRFAFRTLREE
jgi:hypothetical protein